MMPAKSVLAKSIASHRCGPSHLGIVAVALEPAPAGNAYLVQEPPVAQGHVYHHAGRAVELRVSVSVSLRQIANDMLARPAAARYPDSSRSSELLTLPEAPTPSLT